MRRGFAFVIMSVFLLCTAVQAQTYYAWVANSLGETLSKVNLSTGTVINNAVTLGSGPNEIKIEGNIAYIVNSLDNHVQIVDLDNGLTTGTIELYLGMNPYYIAMDGQDRAFVSNLLTANVSVLDLNAGTETSVINTGGIPEGVCVHGERLYVTDVVDYSGNWVPGKVYAYNLATLSLEATATVGINPQIVQMGPDGNLHVICTGNYWDINGQVDIVDPATMTVTETISLGGSPGSLEFTSQGIGFVGGGGWEGEGSVFAYNGLTYEVLFDDTNPIVVPAPALGVKVTHDDHVLICCFNSDQLVELDSNGTISRSFTVGDGPISVDIQNPPNAVGSQTVLPDDYSVSYNFPEPFNASTTISYYLSYRQSVTLKVYDVQGNMVLERNLGFRPAGANLADFTPGSDLVSGHYLYCIDTGSEVMSGTMVYLK